MFTSLYSVFWRPLAFPSTLLSSSLYRQTTIGLGSRPLFPSLQQNFKLDLGALTPMALNIFPQVSSSSSALSLLSSIESLSSSTRCITRLSLLCSLSLSLACQGCLPFSPGHLLLSFPLSFPLSLCPCPACPPLFSSS